MSFFGDSPARQQVLAAVFYENRKRICLMGSMGDSGFGLPPFWLFGDSRKRAVWQKGQAVLGYDSSEYRLDSHGNWIRYSEYGQMTTYGWEIDHINPSGPDELWNLQPLFWRNNRRKSDKPPSILDLFGVLNRK